MSDTIATSARWHEKFRGIAAALQHAFLLLIRLYWGWQLATSGWNKLTNISGTASYFEGLGIALPTFNAVLSGAAECFGGLLLVVGLGSRVIAVILIFNFAVAFWMAHREQALALFSHPHEFVTAPPFLFLMVCAIVLVFGPGVASLDAALERYFSRRLSHATAAVALAGQLPIEESVTRRQLIALSVTAVGGLVVGAQLAGANRDGRRSVAADGTGNARSGSRDLTAADPANPKTGVAAGNNSVSGGEAVSDCLAKVDVQQVAAIREMDEEAPDDVQPSLLLAEPHVCCGLNSCEGKAKGGGNSCAGQGSCATAKSHPCQGFNDCKGQGGCGEHPGQNACDGKGSCAVPLDKKQWEIARPKFEQLASLAGCQVGSPPADCPK